MKNNNNINEKLKIALIECPKTLDFSSDISKELKEPQTYLGVPEGYVGHAATTIIVKKIK